MCGGPIRLGGFRQFCVGWTDFRTKGDCYEVVKCFYNTTRVTFVLPT